MLKDRKRLLTCLLFFILILTIYSVTVYAYEIDEIVQVTRVIDGDSFEVSGDEVRLADVSAPEWNMPDGTEATNALSNLISGKMVYLDTDQKSGRGPYGRLIAVVYIKHNFTHYKNVNEALLQIRVVSETDYTNNEFNPSTWTLFVRYAFITPPSPSKPADFEFSNLEITPKKAELGMSVTVSIDVTNVGEEMGGCTVELKVNGEVVDSVEIPPFGGGITATQFFYFTMGEGNYQVEVEGLTGSFTVVKPEHSFWDKIPGFSYESIIIGLIAVIVIIWRARNF